MKINWMMFLTGILQFGAGTYEIIRGNVTLGLVYMAYGFSACALSTV
jgi:hypothetical protein